MNFKSVIFLTILLFFTLLTLKSNAEPIIEIGKVIAFNGSVYIKDKAGNKRDLALYDNIYLNQTINTDDNSKVQLKLADGSLISLQSNSSFYISKFIFDKNNPKNNNYEGNLIKGSIVNVSGENESKNYQLKSPFAVISFKGTMVVVKLNEKNGVVISENISVPKGNARITSVCFSTACIPRQMDIGVGKISNSLMIDNAGQIRRRHPQDINTGYGYSYQLEIEQNIDSKAYPSTSEIISQLPPKAPVLPPPSFPTTYPPPIPTPPNPYQY